MLSYKRLDRGTFSLPTPVAEGAQHVAIDEAALQGLLDGMNVEVAPEERPRRPKVH